MLVTRQDGRRFGAALRPYPSQRILFNNFFGGLITDGSDPLGAGNWADRAGYFAYPMMGHTMQVAAHLLKLHFDLRYPYLEAAFNRSLNGDLRPHKSPQEFAHWFYPSVLLVSPRFPALAPQALRNLRNATFQREHNITGQDADLAKALYGAGVFAPVWFDPGFAEHPEPAAACGNGVKEGREPCDGADFGPRLADGVGRCAALSPLYLSGSLECHDCRIVADACVPRSLNDGAVAGGIA